MKEASLLFCLPDNPFFLPKSPESHAVQEATYACEFYSGFSSPFCDICGSRLWLDLCSTLLQPSWSCVPAAQKCFG
jgi:hypothetical protein